MVCLAVSTLLGLLCIPGAAQIGDCLPNIYGLNVCVVDDPTEIPIRASWYNPLLGGINCVDPCDETGDGTPIDMCWDNCISCPIEWYSSELNVQYAGVWQCRDTGPAMGLNYGEYYTPDGFKTGWFITIDFMLRKPEWWTYLILDWEIVK